MKRLEDAQGVIMTAAKFVKTDSGIEGYDEKGMKILDIEGVRNFSLFSLLDGAEWDFPVLSTEEELAIYKKRLDETENALLSLMDMSLMGGI